MNESELRRENEILRDRIAELEAVLGLTASLSEDWAYRMLLKQQLRGLEQRRLLGLLLKRGQVPREAAFAAIYGDRAENDQPDIKILDVFISHMRKALRVYDIEIKTVWGQGWRIDAENRRKASEFVQRMLQAA